MKNKIKPKIKKQNKNKIKTKNKEQNLKIKNTKI
jgi:hypothetical protein